MSTHEYSAAGYDFKQVIMPRSYQEELKRETAERKAWEAGDAEKGTDKTHIAYSACVLCGEHVPNILLG